MALGLYYLGPDMSPDVTLSKFILDLVVGLAVTVGAVALILVTYAGVVAWTDDLVE